MLPTLHKQPFSHPDWIFEPKWDGYRALCTFEHDSVKFASRNHRDLTKRFPELGTIHQAIGASSAVIDGEIVGLDKEGFPCFSDLQNRAKCYVVFFAFDLLALNGNDLRDKLLLTRKTLLRDILGEHPRLRFTDYISEHGEKLFAELERLRIEGMVCKRIDSRYTAGRSKSWLKIRTKAGSEEMKRRVENWGRG